MYYFIKFSTISCPDYLLTNDRSLQELTLNTIGTCGFGFDPKNKELANEFLERCRAMFDFMDTRTSSLIVLMKFKGILK